MVFGLCSFVIKIGHRWKTTNKKKTFSQVNFNLTKFEAWREWHSQYYNNILHDTEKEKTEKKIIWIYLPLAFDRNYGTAANKSRGKKNLYKNGNI